MEQNPQKIFRPKLFNVSIVYKHRYYLHSWKAITFQHLSPWKWFFEYHMTLLKVKQNIHERELLVDSFLEKLKSLNKWNFISLTKST